jgi:hypothetical protein
MAQWAGLLEPQLLVEVLKLLRMHFFTHSASQGAPDAFCTNQPHAENMIS